MTNQLYNRLIVARMYDHMTCSLKLKVKIYVTSQCIKNAFVQSTGYERMTISLLLNLTKAQALSF